MYGRMQFADFVVSWALQALSRSLQKVSDANRPDGIAAETGLKPSDQKALTETAERIFSLWQMVQWSVGKVEFKRAQADLKQVIELTVSERIPERLAAEMGMYADDPYGDLGRLQAELHRAVRLVTDTGMHAKRWTREEAIDYLEKTAALTRKRYGDIKIHFDLSELHGYHYKTGVVFAAFVPQLGQAIARGGRYDDIGEVFGRARAEIGRASCRERV